MLNRTFSVAICFVLVAFVALSSTDAFAVAGGNPQKFNVSGKKFQPGADKFCWRNSYATGKGVKQKCGSGNESVGRFCLKKCGAGTERVGFKCKSTCPDGFASGNLTCKLTGSDKKYANDKHTFNKKDFLACEAWHGKGACVLNGSSKYVKQCKNGFKVSGKNCVAEKLDCAKYGLKAGIGRSCKRSVDKGVRMAKAGCSSGKEKSFGLCYTKCNKGDYRVGSTCWMKAPPNWVKCGPLSYSKNKKACAQVKFSQATSVGMLAFNIATMGGASALDSAVDTVNVIDEAAEASKWSKAFDGMMGLWKKTGKMRDLATLKTAEETVAEGETAHDYARGASTALSIIDPTGIASVVGSFSYDACLKYYN